MLIGLNGFAGVGKDTVGEYLVRGYQFERLAFADKLKDAVAALWGISREEVDKYKFPEHDEPPPGVGLWSFFDSSDRMVGPCWSKISIAGMTWRTFLQRFGTEMAREVFGYDFWVNLILPDPRTDAITLPFYKHRKIVITDARFGNELQRIRDLGGFNIRIQRTVGNVDTHISEQPPDPDLIDYTLPNYDDLDTLYHRTELILSDIAERNYHANSV